MIPSGFPNLKTVAKSINTLYRHLKPRTIELFCVSVPRTVALLNAPRDPALAVQQIARTIAHFLNLRVGLIIVAFRSDIEEPGRVEITAADDFHIEVNSRYKACLEDVCAILAHEITHIFLTRVGLRFENGWENEVLTDTTSLYLGVGWMALESFRETRSHYSPDGGRTVGVRVTVQHLGYLTPDESAYVLAKRSMLFHERQSGDLRSAEAQRAYRVGRQLAVGDYHVPPLAAGGVTARIAYFWRRRRADRTLAAVGDTLECDGYSFCRAADGLRVTFTCPVCCQKLRVPVGVGRLTSHCPVCEHSWECKS